jgi:hypothetical protein
MGDLLTLGLFIAVGIGFWWMFRPRYAFVVQIQDGNPVCRRGRVNSVFLRHVAEICQWSGVRCGKIYGTLQPTRGRHATVMGRRARIRLSFSSGIPMGCRQQLRNLSQIEQ